MRIISVINHKGGVGKTTTAAHLGKAMALNNKHVSMIDLDPQGHLTAALCPHEESGYGIGDVLAQKVSIDSAGKRLDESVKLVPPGKHLSDLGEVLPREIDGGMRLQKAISAQKEKNDFVFIDCPPSAGMLSVNALFASHELLVPVVGDYLSLCGVSGLLKSIKKFEKTSGRYMPIWFVLTKFYPRGRLAREVRNKLVEMFPGRVLQTAIRETVALSECPARRKTIFEYNPCSKGAEDYMQLADDLMSGRVL